VRRSINSNLSADMNKFEGLWYDSEGLPTDTSEDQRECEMFCSEFLVSPEECSKAVLRDMRAQGLLDDDNCISLLRIKHTRYLKSNMSSLPQGFASLDASRPWIMYWITHSLYLLDAEDPTISSGVIRTLRNIQNIDGGFGGGPQQLSHGAPNYASVMTLCEICTEESLSLIDRGAMYNYLISMKHPGGGFRMHRDGEVDTRSCYTALAVARLLNILTTELVAGVADYLLSCQTYEGGFGGEPGNEAHGGYNFCALAGLIILGEGHRCNIQAQRRWLLSMQTRLEGGFRGRTNKLVDACYSYWQGAAFSLLALLEAGLTDTGDCYGQSDEHCLDMNSLALQRYILHCCQHLEGGLRDKPGKNRDFYHSCYALSGLSIAQHGLYGTAVTNTNGRLYGATDNLLKRTSCVFNIGCDRLVKSMSYFSSMPSSHDELSSMYSQHTS